MRPRIALLLAACLLGVAVPAPAENVPLTPPQRAFVDRYVDALRAKDATKLRALVHPKSLACIRPESAAFFDEVFARRLRDGAAGPYRASAGPIPPGDPLLMEGDLTYPVRPTHWIQIDLDPDAASSATHFVQVAARGTWFEVVPCPTPATLAKLREKKIQDGKDTQRARELLAKLQDPLLAELKGLVSEGRIPTAIVRYSKATGESTGVASRLIELLEARK